MKHSFVYLVCYVKSVDPFELPLAVLSSQRNVAKFLDIPKSNIQRSFANGCNVAIFGRYQIEKIYID